MIAKKNKNRIQVIERAVSILRVIRDSQAGLSLGKIANQVNLPRSTVQRIVTALETERMVISSDKRGGWVLGPELQTMVQKATWNIVDACRPELFELSRRTGETVDLSVFRGVGMIFLDTIAGNQRLAAMVSIGDIFPLTSTANGRAALSLMDNKKIESLIKLELGNTISQSEISSFIKKIELVRLSGFSYDLEEHTKGVCAIGIPFKDWSGNAHAISVPIPATRYKENKSMIEKELKNLSMNINHLISNS